MPILALLPRYKRPEMPFEREASLWVKTGRWSAIGLEFGLAVVLFFLGGQWLDGIFSTSPWLSVVGALIGVAAGMYLMVRPFLSQPTPRPPEDAPPSPPAGDEGRAS